MTSFEWWALALLAYIAVTMTVQSQNLTKIARALAPPAPAAPSRAPANPSDPRPGNHSLAGETIRRVHKGYTYAVHGDGAVIATTTATGLATWRSEPEFKAWAEANP